MNVSFKKKLNNAMFPKKIKFTPKNLIYNNDIKVCQFEFIP